MEGGREGARREKERERGRKIEWGKRDAYKNIQSTRDLGNHLYTHESTRGKHFLPVVCTNMATDTYIIYYTTTTPVLCTPIFVNSSLKNARNTFL